MRVAIAWVAPNARAIGPTISSPDADTTTTSRPHSLWSAMSSASSNPSIPGICTSCWPPCGAARSIPGMVE